MNPYSFENPTFGSLLVYGALLIFKTMLLVPLTIYQRLTKGTVPALEDAKNFARNNPEKQKKLLRPNEDVERVIYFYAFFLKYFVIYCGSDAGCVGCGVPVLPT